MRALSSDDVSLKAVKNVRATSVTEQQREAGADVPEDVRQRSLEVRRRMRRGQVSFGSHTQRSRKDLTVSASGRTPKSRLSSSGKQKCKVQRMMVRASSKRRA